MANLKKALKNLIDSWAIKNSMPRAFAVKSENLNANGDTDLEEIKMFAEITKVFQSLCQKGLKECDSELKSNSKLKNDIKLKKLNYNVLEKFSRIAKDNAKQIFKKVEAAKKAQKNAGEFIKKYASVRNNYFEKLSDLSPKNTEDSFTHKINTIYEFIKNSTGCDKNTYDIIKLLNQALITL